MSVVRAMAVAAVLVLASSVWAAEQAPKAEPAAPKAEAKPPEAKPAPAPETEPFKTPSAKLSYALGMEIGGVLKPLETEIDLANFFRGIEDVLKGKELLLTQDQALQVKKDFATKLQEEELKKRAEQAAKNLKAGQTFLDENKKKPGVQTTKSGLQYRVIQEGKGPSPKPEDSVQVSYAGKLIDGTNFAKTEKPEVLFVTRVIPGLSEALQLMRVGGKYELFIPPDLAYEDRGREPMIGPNSVLIFEVELLGIGKPAEPEPKPEAKPEAKPEPKPEAKPEAKPEPKPEAKPEGGAAKP